MDPRRAHNNKHIACLVCGHKKLDPLPQEYAHATLVRCQSCQFIFSETIPTEEELLIHYSSYRRNNNLSSITIQRYNELLNLFEIYRQTNRLLDIGCGDGYFLVAAKARGWNVFGTEYTDEAIKICSEKGIQMYKGAIEAISFDQQKFDVVTSFEVLEHLNNAKEHISTIHNLIREKGVFYFTTPNFNSLSRRKLGGNWSVIEYPEHLSYYTPQTIDLLLKQVSFRKLQLKTTGISIQRLQGKGTTSTSNRDEVLRQKFEHGILLQSIKGMINSLLTLFNAGDTIKGLYQKQ